MLRSPGFGVFRCVPAPYYPIKLPVTPRKRETAKLPTPILLEHTFNFSLFFKHNTSKRLTAFSLVNTSYKFHPPDPDNIKFDDLAELSYLSFMNNWIYGLVLKTKNINHSNIAKSIMGFSNLCVAYACAF